MMRKLSREATLHLLLQGMWKGLQEAKTYRSYYESGMEFHVKKIEPFVLMLGKKARRDPNFSLSRQEVNKLNQFLDNTPFVSSYLRKNVVRHCEENQCEISQNDFRFKYDQSPKGRLFHVTGEVRWDSSDGREKHTIDEKVERLTDVLSDWKIKGIMTNGKGFEYNDWSFERGVIKQSARNGRGGFPNEPMMGDPLWSDAELELKVDGKPISAKIADSIIKYFKKGRYASVKKLSREATLHMLLQGMWKGIQKAKADPAVQAKYPRGLDFIERMVTELGKKAKRDPNFLLSPKQVKKLNQFLSGNSGVLSSVLREHIVNHCTGNQCTMVGQNQFRFQYVGYHVTGTLEHYETEGNAGTIRINKTVNRLSEALSHYKDYFEGWGRGSTTIFVEGDTVKMESMFRPNPRDIFDEWTKRSDLKLEVNGRPLTSDMLEKVADYYRSA